jgi:hypothetical protein
LKRFATSAAYPTVKYEKAKTTAHFIKHMQTFHAHDGLHWAILKRRELLQKMRVQQSARMNPADMHNSLVAFVGFSLHIVTHPFSVF